MANRQQTIEAYTKRFGEQPQFLVRAPGRVNLIGEHTDYNDGFVLPMAIDRATWIALSPQTGGTVLFHSADHGEDAEFEAMNPEKGASMSWAEYPKGVAWSLREEGLTLEGWRGATICDVPMGAGLSSSASFELAVARAFRAVSGFDWDAKRMAVAGQRAENKWVGVNCGIMDQMISAIGQEGMAVLIDCRDYSTRLVPLPPGTVAVIMDTMTRRGLVESAYNERRAQCEAAARHFKVKALRDVSSDRLSREGGALEPLTLKRARHVVTENERTLAAAEAMERGDAEALGALMNASHESLRDDFEVTNAELDIIVQLARRIPGCRGARMTGAGFGGCSVALVDTAAAAHFVGELAQAYERETSRAPAIYVCQPSNGAEEISP